MATKKKPAKKSKANVAKKKTIVKKSSKKKIAVKKKVSKKPAVKKKTVAKVSPKKKVSNPVVKKVLRPVLKPVAKETAKQMTIPQSEPMDLILPDEHLDHADIDMPMDDDIKDLKGFDDDAQVSSDLDEDDDDF